jgi:HEAT repeat protein
MDTLAARLGRVLSIRPGEGRAVAGVAALFALLEVGRGFGEIGVETLVQGRFGPTNELPTVLPFLFMGLGAAGLVVALAYTAALGRFARGPLFVALLGLSAAAIVALWLGLRTGSDAALLLLWLMVYVIGSLSMTVYWTVAGATFDARQAKRVFPLLTAAAIAGAFLGSLAAGPAAALLGAQELVILEAIAFAIGVPLVGRLVARARQAPRSRTRHSMTADLRVGFDVVAASPLLRRIAAAYVLLAVLSFSVQYPFTISAAANFPDDAERAAALGILSAAITATSFVVSFFLANRVYARFGVSIGALLLPVVYALGFGVWLVQFAFPTAAAVRFTQQVTQRGLSNSSWSAFYNVVPGDRRAQVLAFEDGVPGQLGTVLSGLMLLIVGRILAPDQLFWIGAVTAVVAVLIVLGVRRGYGASLVSALRGGAAEQILEGGPGVAVLLRDPSVEAGLVDAIQAPEPGVREIAATLLGRVGTSAADTAVRAAIADDDPRVRVAAIRALSQRHGGGLPEDVDGSAMLADPDPRVRAAAVVADAGTDPAATLALALDPLPVVRAAAIEALAPHDGGPLDPEVRRVVVAALDDETGRVRAAAAAALGTDDGPATDLIPIVEQGWRRASTAALDALADRAGRQGQDPDIRPSILAFALTMVDRATEIRHDRLALGSPADPAAAFLVDVLADRERDLVRSLLGALAALGAPEASGLIRRCLAADDPETRAQAIEALESLGDRALASRVVRLLEDAASDGLPTRDTVLTRLAHDDDPWLRRLALACRGGPDVPEATRSRTELETMLALRRVPLFEGLDPEDLQRIAATAVERTYAADEPLMTEGDLGDELVILLEGSVRVERVEPDGSMRQIRTFEAGEHIGELAVLRERPRVATVAAEADGARGLVVSGTGLKAILRERPDAAMAMLATLAERISRQ